MALALDGDQRPRPRGRLVHRLAGRDRHRHDATARRGSSRSGRGRVHEALDAGKIVIVAGFQGVSTDDATSRRSAAAAPTRPRSRSRRRSHADVCEIYTDVDGVFTADPRIVPERAQARRRSRTRRCSSWRRAARASWRCARSSTLATTECKIHVRSSFNDAEGTWIVKEEDMLEQAIISGIAHDTSEAKVTIRARARPARRRRRAPSAPLADAGINIDMIVQNTSVAGLADISFTLPRGRARRRRADPRASSRSEIGAAGFTCERRHRQGLGRRRRHAAATRASRPTSSRRSPTPASTSRSSRPRRSASRASCRASDAERAVNVLHERLKLADVFYDASDVGRASSPRGRRRLAHSLAMRDRLALGRLARGRRLRPIEAAPGLPLAAEPLELVALQRTSVYDLVLRSPASSSAFCTRQHGCPSIFTQRFEQR